MASHSNTHGAVVTVGLMVAGNRAQVVIPIIDTNESRSYTDVDFSRLIADELEANLYPLIQAVMSSEAYIAGLTVEPMMDGGIPERRAYLPSSYVGSIVGEVLPASCGALITWYQDPGSMTPGSRMHVAKNVWPGVPEANQDGGIINSGFSTALGTLRDYLRDGFTAGTGSLFKRAMRVGRVVGDQIEEAVVGIVREYIGTIRRRLTPHY